MDWGYLYTSLEGRISRKPYWLATLLMILVCGPLLFFLLITGGSSVTILVQLLLVYPSFALALKRAHDRNRHPALIVGFFALAVLLDIMQLLGFGAWRGVPLIIFLLWLASIILLIIDLGFFRGTKGPNQYGPDPLDDGGH
jgi:uncharacterized membrane protein YhaH (DUF805 family)